MAWGGKGVWRVSSNPYPHFGYMSIDRTPLPVARYLLTIKRDKDGTASSLIYAVNPVKA
jgi:hypothetical protein